MMAMNTGQQRDTEMVQRRERGWRGEVVDKDEDRGEGRKDKREGERKDHRVKVLSGTSRLMWHSAQCEISTSLSYNDWGKGGFTQTHKAALSRRSRVMDFLH